MKQQLFGLRKAHINKMIRQLKHDYSTEIHLLEDELNQLKADNSKLEIELKAKLDRNLMNKEDEIWSLGKQRIGRVIAYLNDQQETEINEIKNCFTETAENVKMQIKEAEKEIQMAESLLSHTLNQFIDRIENPNTNQWKKESKQDEQKNEGNAHELPVTIVYPNDLSGKEIATALDSVQQVQDYPIQDDSEEITGIKDPVKQEDKTREVYSETQDKRNANPFWGDMEEWANIDFTILDDAKLQNNQFMQIDKEFSKKRIDGEKELNFSTNNKQEAVIRDERMIETASAEQDISEHSEVLLEQIDAIKTQYIVGKVAGEELYDLSGRIIAAKNSLITREVVEKANRAGKLAELIVNMKLDEAGED